MLATPLAITPAKAARWMNATFPKLANFTGLAFYPHTLHPPRHREEIRSILSALAMDADVMARACAESLATGRSVRVECRPPFPVHAGIVRKLRAALVFEARHPHGVRTVLRRTLALAERECRRAKAA